MLEGEILESGSTRTPANEDGEEDVDYNYEEDVTIIEGGSDENEAPLNQDYVQEHQINPGDKVFVDFNDDGLLDGTVHGRVSQPVLTQQIIMDLIVNHP
jgi:hypothetical protein